jgi:hypothetical protein
MQSIREVKGIAVIFAHRIPLAVIGIPNATADEQLIRARSASIPG